MWKNAVLKVTWKRIRLEYLHAKRAMQQNGSMPGTIRTCSKSPEKLANQGHHLARLFPSPDTDPDPPLHPIPAAASQLSGIEDK
jgi:hypothetical protein